MTRYFLQIITFGLFLFSGHALLAQIISPLNPINPVLPSNPAPPPGTPCVSGRFIDDVFTDVKMRSVSYAKAVNVLGVNQTLDMDIYQPVGDTMQKRPLIIYIHGGAFIAGDRKLPEAIYFCRSFARKGYVTASMQYRLGCDLPLNKDNMLKAVMRAVQDARGAVQFFRKNAAVGGNSYKIDPNQIYIAGYSAGAITALHLAYLDKATEFQEIADTSIINAMGGINSYSGNNGGYSWKVKGVITFAGALGKAHWMEPGDAPLISMHGTDDHIVPYNTGEPLFGIINPPLFMDGSVVIDSFAATIGVCDDLYSIRGRDHLVYYLDPVIANKCIQFITPRMCALLHNIPFCCANFGAKAQAGADNSVCKGQSVQINTTVFNKNGPLTYSWQGAGINNATTASVSVSPTVNTTYTVTVHDGAGCAVTSTVLVTVKPLPVGNAGANQTTCANSVVSLNGSATGGVPPYSYHWSPSFGLNNANVQNPSANPGATTVYTLTVTDAKGCQSAPKTTTLTVLPAPQISYFVTDASCFGCNDGAINATATGGFSPYDFWLDGTVNQPNGVFTNLAAGQYQIMVFDMNGCGSETNITVNAPAFTCNTPTNISVSGVMDSVVTLNWSPVNGASAYEIRYRKQGQTAWKTEITNAVPYQIDTLYPDVDYQYEVRTICGANTTSNWSATQTFHTLDGCIPPYYINVTPGTVSATIDWEDVPHAAGYWVSYKSSIDLLWTDVWVPASYYAFASILIPFTSYDVRIKTDCSGLFNNSGWSGVVTFDTNSPRYGQAVSTVFDQLTLYPNPNKGAFTLGFEQAPESPVEIKITDLTGRTVHSQTITEIHNKTAEISLPNPVAGVYLLRLNRNGQESVFKFVVE